MARSLVDVLNARAEEYCKLYRDKWRTDRAQLDGKALEAEAAADLAAPYEARRLALERAFADAKAAQGRHGLVTAWRFLEEALAAIPEIPEES